MHTAALERNFSNAEKDHLRSKITNNKVKACKLVFFPRQQIRANTQHCCREETEAEGKKIKNK